MKRHQLIRFVAPARPHAALAALSLLAVLAAPLDVMAQETAPSAAPVPSPAPADEFPVRKEYPNVSYIATEDLSREYETTLIIDVRAQFEYDVMHIKKAVNIPVAVATFMSDLEKVRPKDGAQKIAFYCNGHTCKKSYQATDEAMKLGFKNVYAYDAGIFEWVKEHPDKGIFFGESPVLVEKIISKEVFEKRLLSYEEFSIRAKDPSAVVIDIREPFQREKLLDFPGEKNIPIDRLGTLLAQGKFKDKHLLCYDAVGKQVEWLQYYLEKYGYADYHFLKKGVEGAAGK